MIERLKQIGPQTNITLSSAMVIIGMLFSGWLWLDDRLDTITSQNVAIQNEVRDIKKDALYIADMRNIVNSWNKEYPDMAFLNLDDVLEKRDRSMK